MKVKNFSPKQLYSYIYIILREVVIIPYLTATLSIAETRHIDPDIHVGSAQEIEVVIVQLNCNKSITCMRVYYVQVSMRITNTCSTKTHYSVLRTVGRHVNEHMHVLL